MNAPFPRSVPRPPRRRGGGRGQVRRLLDLADHLPPGERRLFQQVYELGIPASQVAQLLQQPPRCVRRRLAQVLRRLRRPAFAALARHGRRLPAHVAEPLRRVVFAGATLRQAGQTTGQSLHQVRRHLALLEVLHHL